jgi:ABC-type dipeptide/oligopeptide/nickel transport system ATPase component
MNHPHLLDVQDLVVKFALRSGDLTALNGINFTLNPGERMGLVGESGAGSSASRGSSLLAASSSRARRSVPTPWSNCATSAATASA